MSARANGLPERRLGLRPWHRRGLVLALLLAVFGGMTYNAVAQSPTMDEQNHIARGYALLRTGDARLSLEHPPLINLLEALPLGTGVALPLDHPSWENGNWYYFAATFLWERNSKQDRMVFLARMPVIALTLMLGALASRWARELGGPWVGLMASALVLLDPNILAHGSLATTDLGITLMVLLTAYALWRVSGDAQFRGIARPPKEGRRVARSLHLFAAGLALGAMLATKMSALLFWGLFGLIFVLDQRTSRRHNTWLHRVMWRGMLYAGLSLVALLVLWASYAFEVAPVVEGGVPVPMGTYWRGVRTVFDTLQGGRPSYLMGETRLGGWPLYFPIAFGVKTPLPTLSLLLLAVVVRPGRRRRAHEQPRRAALYLLVPVLAYWIVALRSDLNLGYRHLLPTLPMLFVWAAARLARSSSRPVWRRISLGLALWLCVETLWIAPHFLAYFNPVGGGPSGGWRVLADSNIDWGQDLKYLRDYLAREAPDETVKLSWFGSSPPDQYGIRYEPLPGWPHYSHMWFEPPTFDEEQPEPGLYVISVSNLVELPLVDKHFFTYFRQRPPDARIGYSVYVYRVEETP
ncbi:MAG: ArnT family glycosyltransferase [Anaerolineae bacterium]